MMKLRPEVKKFCDVAETLLSPALLDTPLTEEEMEMITIYMQSLQEKLLSTAKASRSAANDSAHGAESRHKSTTL